MESHHSVGISSEIAKSSCERGTLAAIHRLEKDIAFVLNQTQPKGYRVRDTRKGQSDLEPTVDQPAVVEARVELSQLRRHLPAVDWQLISSVAIGMGYRTVAREIGGTPGGLRIRTMRIRQALLSLAA